MFQMPDSYEPHPEFTSYKPRSEAPNWLLSTFYVGFMVYAVTAIVVSAGTIYNKQKCSVYSDGAETGAIVFEIMGYITAVLSFVVIIMCIFALVYRMGFREQVLYLRKLVDSGPNPSEMSRTRMSLEEELNRNTLPYSQLETS
jgi:large-conductance mechanosensitive channel